MASPGLVKRGLLVLSLLVAVALLLVARLPAGASGLLVYAHRGDTNPRDGYPENTLPAIAQSVGRGADGIEFDVQVSLDGTIWLLHDETVDRTTDGKGRLVAMHDAQIEALRVDGGVGWRTGMSPQRIPRLRDVLRAAGSHVRLEVDLKSPGDDAARLLGQALGTFGDRTTINVKRHSQIPILRAAVPGVTIAAQPDWIPDALTAGDLDVVIVWGDQLTAAEGLRPPNRIELFRNSEHEAAGPDETKLIDLARGLGLRAVLTDDLPKAMTALR